MCRKVWGFESLRGHHSTGYAKKLHQPKGLMELFSFPPGFVQTVTTLGVTTAQLDF